MPLNSIKVIYTLSILIFLLFPLFVYGGQNRIGFGGGTIKGSLLAVYYGGPVYFEQKEMNGT